MGSSVKTNSWILIGNARETACFESNSFFARFIFIFIPNFLSQVSGKSWTSIRLKESFKIIKTFSGIMNFEMIDNWFWFWSLWGFSDFWFWSFCCFWFSFWSFLDWFCLGSWLSLSYWFWFCCFNWSSWSNWSLLHLRGLWFESSSLSFLFCNNTCSLELWKITTFIHSFSKAATFSSNFFWMRPASWKTFRE